MSDNKSQQLRDVVCDIAVHHMPHDAAQLEDEDVIGAAIQHMWWNYIDDHQGQKGLPNLSEEEFVRLVFKYIKALQPKAKHGWKRYQAFVKRGWQKVTCGVALVDPTRTKVLLVKGHDATTYGFPKGKLEEGEDLLSCALREAYEETQFRCDMYIQEEDVLHNANSHVFVAFGVPTDTNFDPQFEGEIKEIMWVTIDEPEVPLNKFSRPFFPRLRKFLKRTAKQGRPLQYELVMREDTPFVTPAIWREPFNLKPHREKLKSIWPA